MASYGAEPDPEFADQALVVRLPDPGEQHGRTVGWCAGPGAEENAWEVAAWIRQHGTQPPAETCERMGYTPKEGEEP